MSCLIMSSLTVIKDRNNSLLIPRHLDYDLKYKTNHSLTNEKPSIMCAKL